MSRSTAVSTVQALEQQVSQLTPAELAEFRDWFHDHEWKVWDRQLEQDAKAGKLDELARKAREHHAAGRTTPL
jgi:hypothetical protein